MKDAPAAARYVAGRMSESEIAEFESQMLSSPELAADVNVRQRIKAGLELLEERQVLGGIVSGAHRAARHRRLALAAGLAVVAVSATLVWWSVRGDHSSHLFAAGEISQAPSTPSFMLAAIRGGAAPVLEVPAGTEFVELRTLVDGDGDYEVRLVPDASGGIRASVGTDGLIRVGLRVSGLQSGSYHLSVTPSGQSGSEQKFAFQLRLSR
jgi:hypothetical protein